MTLPGFVNEEDQMEDGRRIQRLFSHACELPSPIDLEPAANDPAAARPSRQQAKRRSGAGRKRARRRRLVRGGERRDAALPLEQK
jgi:hypothetical protein